MRVTGRAVAITALALVLLNCGAATAKNPKNSASGKFKVKGTFSGDWTAGPDTNGDTIPSAIGNNAVQEDTKFGTFSVDYTSEVLASTGQGSCPSGMAEFPYAYDEGTATLQSSGDQLFFSYTSATLCLNQSTGALTFHGTADYTGGTGAFEGASGSFTADSTGTLNLVDFSGTQNGSFKGTLVIP